MVNNPPAMQEIWVRFLGWEDPLEREMATHSSILAWRIPLIGAWQAIVHGTARVRRDLATKQQCMINTITKVCKNLQTNKGAGPDHFNGEF